MQQFWAIGRMAVLALAVAGCQFGSLGGGDAPASDVAAPTALQGPAVEVTALAPMGQAAPLAEPVQAQEPAEKPAEPVAPPVSLVVKSAGQIACEKKGGRFAALPNTGAMTCQMTTRDAGKQCRRESDCDGVCLARSNSCAPVKPLLGCQDILQNDGRRVELCID
ncbi:hypothetical protein ACEN2J_05150 [Pseudorhodobacter sp. W20_MBD10_FR17]|uniref:hypothetical protein n=1 Tax=Pseudorhodobacter sp. W20_MBD10_FR17 TaxID=3240266 RepID=UPI003F9E3306